MNRTKIDWCDLTCNPITGCKRGCWYCYYLKMAKRYHWSTEPTYYPVRLKELDRLNPPTDKQNQKRKPWIVKAYPESWLVFICSVSDLFAPWTKNWWREQVLENLRWQPDHVICQLLTKSPEGIPTDSTFLKNIWIGATVTQQSEVHLLDELIQVPTKGVLYVSFEPLLGRVVIPSKVMKALHWIIIGKLTGAKAPFEMEWVQHLLDQAAKYHLPVFIKDNVGWKVERKEFPQS